MAGSRRVCLRVRWAGRPFSVSAPDARALPETLSGVAETLTRDYGIGDVLRDLSSRVPEVLGVAGAGMTLADGGRVRFATAPVEAIAATDELQVELQSGPSVEAVATGRPVTVDDLMVGDWALRWPAYVSRARGAGLRAVAGIPMLADGQAIGAINLYDDSARSWSPQDVRVAGILADIATTCLLHASALQRQRRMSEQLRQALETRVVIEQAKGILAAACGVDVDAAFAILRKHARDRNDRIHDVADAVVNRGLRP